MARKLYLQQAFTLIELMMVVSIMSFLTVIVMPKVTSARDKGVILKCVTQQRGIWEGVQRYEFDYNTTLFTIRNNGVSIRNTLINGQYAKNNKAFECPSSTILDYDDILLTYSGIDFNNTYCSQLPTQHLLR